MTRALITGATGFAGSYLVEECLAAGWEVHGTCSLRATSGQWSSRAHFHAIDLRDAAAVRRLVADLAPQRVFHLATQSSVEVGWADPAATMIDNILMTLHILTAVHTSSPEARTLVVGTSAEYGRVAPADLPLREEQPLRPVDPYAVSKVAADYLALQHFLAHGMPVVRVRPFNHIGPRQQPEFVVADFASQLVAIERGAQPPVLHVGNLEAVRDFTDVRDVARAYRLAIELGDAGAVYNVCSGRGLRIADLLQKLLGACRVAVEVHIDPAKQRPIDTPVLVGSSAALTTATGWQPDIPIDQTLQDILAYWRTDAPRET